MPIDNLFGRTQGLDIKLPTCNVCMGGWRRRRTTVSGPGGGLERAQSVTADAEEDEERGLCARVEHSVQRCWHTIRTFNQRRSGSRSGSRSSARNRSRSDHKRPVRSAATALTHIHECLYSYCTYTFHSTFYSYAFAMSGDDDRECLRVTGISVRERFSIDIKVSFAWRSILQFYSGEIDTVQLQYLQNREVQMPCLF